MVVPPWLDAARGPGWAATSLGRAEGELVLKLDPAEPGGAARAADQVRGEFGLRADAFPPEAWAASRTALG